MTETELREALAKEIMDDVEPLFRQRIEAAQWQAACRAAWIVKGRP